MIVTGPQITSATTHPTAARLASYGLGRLDEPELAAIAEHLAACDACRAVVEAVADDSLALLLREAERRASAGGRPRAGRRTGRGRDAVGL